MISINIFDFVDDSLELIDKLESFTDKKKQVINDFDEELMTSLSCDSVAIGKYTGITLSVDKVYNQTVRVKNQLVQSVIVQELYRAYYRNEPTGSLVTLCKSENAESVKEILSARFGMQFERHSFDLLKIIDEAVDVRNAKFKVQIETVESVSVQGTRVKDTRYYENLFNQGKLNAVIVTFDTPSQAVTFKIDREGMNDNDILNLVEQLLNI